MFGIRFRLFRMFGIPVYVDVSWLIILALITASLANFFPMLLQEIYGEPPELSRQTYWLMGLLTALAFFACILLHELGHAVVGRSYGMPIRGITLFLFGGVAELGDEPPSAWSEFWMAIAGPLVTVALVLVLWVLTTVGFQADWSPAVVGALGWLGTINLLVLVFNLVPAFPLDGGRVLRSILWGWTGDLRRSTFWASQAGRLFSWFLIAWAVLLFLGGNWIGGLWLGLIGLFLNQAALGAYQQVLIRQALEGEPVRRFMNPEPITVPPSLSLREWVDDYVYRYHRKTFPVVADGRLTGCIDTRALSEVPRGEWDVRTVGEVMRQDLCPISVGPDADAMKALGQMQRTGASRLLVTEGDRLLGILSLKDLLRFLELKLELEAEEGTDRPAGLGGGFPARDRDQVSVGS
ncbi:MAG TPA: site-2 protease family protein [Gemmataceae bacterium]